jgi:GAF domain
MAEVHQDSKKVFAVVREELRFASHIVVCAFYISVWRMKRYLWTDSKLRRSAGVVAIVASCVLLGEILLTLFHREVTAWLGKSAVLVLVPAAAILIVHRAGEFRSNRKEVSFAKRVTELVDAFLELGRSLNSALPEKQASLDGFVQALLTQLCGDLSVEGKRPVTASIMMLDKPEGALRIVYLFPVGTKYDPDIGFKPGEGAAGYCYEKSRTVYIPAIRYMHGIVIGEVAGELEYGLMRRLYVPIAEEYEVYDSILCLPVTSKGQGLTHGVLNVDSVHPDAFNMQDVDVLRAYARVLGDAISLYM